MRMHSGGGGVCSYGLNSQAGYLFERSQNALRQRSFERARGVMSNAAKRKTRDRDEDSDGDGGQRYPWRLPGKRVVLDGFKRMRVSSPPESPTPSTTEDAEMTDEEAATPRTTWRTDNKALVPVTADPRKKRPLVVSTAAGAATPPWKTMRRGEYFPTEQPDMLVDASCRAMVVYKSLALAPSPRIELVESDDEQRPEGDGSASPESGDEHFVRFEELPDDEDEPMEVD
ncbi:hypothetical protein BBJ28_00001295 [Nothophytophthora sp. Chile5]|nr:hypothetical protein BBJ28_00001295 [Nothophytophthora sp. Chile5]